MNTVIRRIGIPFKEVTPNQVISQVNDYVWDHISTPISDLIWNEVRFLVNQNLEDAR